MAAPMHKEILRLKSPVCQLLTCLRLHTGPITYFQTTDQLQKTKVSLAASVVNKKLRRLEKAIRQLEKKGQRVLKPIEECEVSVQLSREIRSGFRKREKHVYTREELEGQVLLEKDWARYKIKQHHDEMKVCRQLRLAQEKALLKLREESEELYQQAIQVDDSLLPYTFKGPLNTPPKTGYYPQDGNYIDKTNYFEKDIDILSTDDFLAPKKKSRPGQQ